MHVGILERVDGQPLELLVGAFTASPVPKVILTLAEGEVGRFVAVNQAFGDLLGYDRHELIGQASQIVVAPEDRDAVSDVFEGMITGRIREAVVERVLVRRDGSRVWISSRNFVAHDRSGASFLIAEIVDSSSRQALADSEAWFRSLVDASPIGMAVLDEQGRWTRVNPAVSALLGYTGDDLARLTLSDVTHPGDRDADGPLPDGLASGTGRQVSRRLLRKDGQVLYCLVTVTVLTAESGMPGRFLAQIVDVTAGRRSEDLLDVMITASPDLLALTTLDGTVLRVNAAWRHVLGWSENELTGTRLATLRHPDDIDTGFGSGSYTAAGNDSGFGFGSDTSDGNDPGHDSGFGFGEGTYRYRAKDGGYRWVHWSGRVVPDQRVIMATGRDVTDAFVAEQSAAREADRLHTTIRVQREITAVAADREAVLRLIADRTLEVISTGEAASVHLIDPDGRTMRMVAGTGDLADRDVPAIALSGSIIGAAAASGTTVRCDDTSIDPRASHSLSRTIGMRSLVVAPLRTPAGSVFGALLVASTRPGAFDDGDEQLLTLLADALTGALRHAEDTAARAELTDAQVRRLKDTLQVQREVTAAAADRQAAMHTVARRAVDLFPAADGSAVELLENDHPAYVAAAGTLSPTRDAPAGGAGSVLEVPLHAGGTPIGFLKISAARPGAFDDSDEQQLSLLADSLSSALRHADDAAHTARALTELAVSENRFRLTFDNSPVGLTLSSLRPGELGRYLHANAAMSAITGYSADELSRMTYADLQHPDDIASTDEFARRLREGEIDTLVVERRYLHRQGHTIWVALRVAVVRDDDGNARYVVNQVEDITARRTAEAELRRQARLLELIPAAVIVRELDGTIRWWNARATELYGWPLTAATGKTADRLLATAYPAHGTATEQRERLEHDGRWEGRLQHVTADGRLLTVMSRQVLHQPEPGADGHHEPVQVLEINTDVTAARAAELALADSEQRLRAQFDNSAAGQVIRALDGTLTAVNRAYARMLGHTVDELTGRAEAELLDPAEDADHRHLLAGLFAGDAESYTREGRLRHADGHWVEVEATVSLVRDDTGRPKHLIGVVTDISGRRAAEGARDNAAAALAERNTELEAANQLKLDIIGMLGHEIGNPLTTIQGQAEILADDWALLDDSRRGRAVDAIGRQARRLDDIVREVLAMVTIDAGSIRADRHELSVRAQIDGVLASMDLDTLSVYGDDARVLFAPGHLEQILVNLLSNAAKYGGGATAVRIIRSDDWVHVTVEDSGPGVPEQFRDRLFDRLARAERDATTVKGTGLGLYIVRGLARANHGEVHHEPNPGGGSRFIVDLSPAC